MDEMLDPNIANFVKIRELFKIYQSIFEQIAPQMKKMEDQLDSLRRLLETGSVENLKNHLNNINNIQTRLVNEIRDLNVAYTKLRNAVK
jgi:uncharacterized protein YjgD (DUF1641 family)